MSKSKRKAETIRALDRAILRGLRLYKPDGTLVKTGRELFTLKPEWSPEIGWHYPITAEIPDQPPVENN